KTPLPPIEEIGTSSRRSPSVSTGTISTSSPGWATVSSAATWSACQRASGLLRVAARSTLAVTVGSLRQGVAVEVVELAERVAQAVAGDRPSAFPQRDRWPVQHLVDDAAGQSL